MKPDIRSDTGYKNGRIPDIKNDRISGTTLIICSFVVNIFKCNICKSNITLCTCYKCRKVQNVNNIPNSTYVNIRKYKDLDDNGSIYINEEARLLRNFTIKSRKKWLFFFFFPPFLSIRHLGIFRGGFRWNKYDSWMEKKMEKKTIMGKMKTINIYPCGPLRLLRLPSPQLSETGRRMIYRRRQRSPRHWNHHPSRKSRDR